MQPMHLHETDVYLNWLNSLRDFRARDRIVARVQRLLMGNPGDVGSVGGGVSELRIDYGPGYRVYFWQRGDFLVVLLGGGDKDSQRRDIPRAIELLRDVRNQLGV